MGWEYTTFTGFMIVYLLSIMVTIYGLIKAACNGRYVLFVLGLCFPIIATVYGVSVAYKEFTK